MATYGPEQREVFFASTPLAFRSPMSPTLEAGVSTSMLRIAGGVSGPERVAAWSAHSKDGAACDAGPIYAGPIYGSQIYAVSYNRTWSPPAGGGLSVMKDGAI